MVDVLRHPTLLRDGLRLCEHLFVSVKGSSYKNFQHALATGNLMLVRAAAAELPSITLDDALTICVLLGAQEPDRYERATVRWLGRFCLEKRDVALADVRDAAEVRPAPHRARERAWRAPRAQRRALTSRTAPQPRSVVASRRPAFRARRRMERR